MLLLGWTRGALAEGGAGLQGVVILATGEPIPGASVTAEGGAGAQAATTNSNGEYNIAGLNAGVYRVKITAPGFDPFETEITVGAGAKQEVDAVLMLTPKPLELAPPGAGPE